VRYIEGIKDLQRRAVGIRRTIPTLKLIGETYRTELYAMQVVGMLRSLRRNIDALSAAVGDIEGAWKAPLTPARLRRMILGSDQ
jgi:hypothetical protein